MPVWLVIALKDLRLLARDPMTLFWALGFPVLFGLFFGSIIRVGPETERARVPIAMVDSGEAAAVSETARALRGAEFDVRMHARAEARAAVRRGEAAVFVDFPAPGGGAVQVGFDPSRPSDAELATGALQAVLLRAAAGPDVRVPALERFAITALHDGPRTGFQAVFPAMVLWGLLGCAAAFAVALVSERSSGTLATAGRFRPSGLPPNVVAAEFVPGGEAARRARLVICNGGSSTGYQALYEGVPVLGLPFNFDQSLAMAAIERAGAGRAVRLGDATAELLRGEIERLLRDEVVRAAARRMALALRRCDAAMRFIEFVRDVAP
jgi:hypothetical protein